VSQIKQLIAVIIALIVAISSGCIDSPAKYQGKVDLESFKKISKVRFGFLGVEHEPEILEKAGVRWDRPHPGPFVWNDIDPDGQGNDFNWDNTDSYIDKVQQYDFVTLATIWPFNQSDADKYHTDKPEASGEVFRELPDKLYKPGDMKAYKGFIKALVERYDGDGKDDYEGLKYPIKYWEASNEPSMQNEELTFFQGTPDDYFEILKATYEAVKEADSGAYVLHAGSAGMGDGQKPFWDKMFSIKDVGKYFDIANIHSINASADFWVPDFAKLLKEKGLDDKPIWVTEANLGRKSMAPPPPPPSEPGQGKKPPLPPDKVKPEETELSVDEHAKKLEEAFETAFSSGAEKIFYTSLRANDIDPGTELISDEDGVNSPAWLTFKKLVEKYDKY